jgi:hypothetical protein
MSPQAWQRGYAQVNSVDTSGAASTVLLRTITLTSAFWFSTQYPSV